MAGQKQYGGGLPERLCSRKTKHNEAASHRPATPEQPWKPAGSISVHSSGTAGSLFYAPLTAHAQNCSTRLSARQQCSRPQSPQLQRCSCSSEVSNAANKENAARSSRLFKPQKAGCSSSSILLQGGAHSSRGVSSYSSTSSTQLRPALRQMNGDRNLADIADSQGVCHVVTSAFSISQGMLSSVSAPRAMGGPNRVSRGCSSTSSASGIQKSHLHMQHDSFLQQPQRQHALPQQQQHQRSPMMSIGMAQQHTSPAALRYAFQEPSSTISNASSSSSSRSVRQCSRSLQGSTTTPECVQRGPLHHQPQVVPGCGRQQTENQLGHSARQLSGPLSSLGCHSRAGLVAHNAADSSSGSALVSRRAEASSGTTLVSSRAEASGSSALFSRGPEASSGSTLVSRGAEASSGSTLVSRGLEASAAPQRHAPGHEPLLHAGSLQELQQLCIQYGSGNSSLAPGSSAVRCVLQHPCTGRQHMAEHLQQRGQLQQQRVDSRSGQLDGPSGGRGLAASASCSAILTDSGALHEVSWQQVEPVTPHPSLQQQCHGQPPQQQQQLQPGSVCASSAAAATVSYQQLLNTCASLAANSNAAWMQIQRYHRQRLTGPLLSATPGV